MKNRGGGTLGSFLNLECCKSVNISYNSDVSNHYYNGEFIKNFRGFTLAEVLITLGIIGVIAALTLPSIITKYQQMQTVSQLKRIYSVLYQAINLSEQKDSAIEYINTNISSYDYFVKYLLPNMEGIKPLNYDRNTMPSYRRMNGEIENTFTLFYQNVNMYILKDGTCLFISNIGSTSKSWAIGIDLNDFKGPNVIGKDFFIFSILKEDPVHRLVPYGAYNTSDMPFGEWTRENTQKGSYACSKQGRGQFCAALIMIDGWQIKEGYPW